jgi:hypothetical protein
MVNTKNILLLLKQTNVMHCIGIVLHLNGFIQEQRMKHLIQNKVTSLIYEIGIVYVLRYKQVRPLAHLLATAVFRPLGDALIISRWDSHKSQAAKFMS